MNINNIRTISRRLVNTPTIDWAIILGLSFVVIVALVAVSVSVYLDTESRLDAPPSAITSAHTGMDQVLLKGIVGDADMRAAVWTDKAAHYPIAPDPSLP